MGMTNETKMIRQFNLQTCQWEIVESPLEHDDLYDADAYDRRRAERDGWTSSVWDGR